MARRLAAENGIRSLVIRDPSGDVLASIGPGNAVATYELDLTDPGGSLGLADRLDHDRARVPRHGSAT